MEAKEFLNQKRIGLVNKLRLKRTGENQIYPC